MATPAEGPSLGMAPAGTWTWISEFSSPFSGILKSLVLLLIRLSAVRADSFITLPS